jgi:trehalose/maltose transport system substrate-binding protein
VLEWVASYGGGTIIGDDGEITINNPLAMVAISRAAGWVGTIAPEAVTNYREEDARIQFQRGEAVFMRNWPYAWALLNADDSAVQGQVGVASLPQGGPQGNSAATLGGWQLAVSRYSESPEEAADLVRYLTSAEVQRTRAIEGSYAPTISELYEDPEVLAANPLFGQLSGILENAVARPTAAAGEDYMAVSTRLWEAVNYVLLGATSARESLTQLEDALRLIIARDRPVAAQ